MTTHGLALPRTGRQYAANQRTTEVQLLLLLATAGLSWLILAAHAPQGLIATCLLTVGVGIAGVVLAYKTSQAVGDPAVRHLGYWHLLKMPLVLGLLYWGWVPDLQSTYADSGYDPHRYYYQAQELAENGFANVEWVSAMNYSGILYYYGFIFQLFGHNPAAPAIVNCLTTSVATLLIVRAAYMVHEDRWSGWGCGLAILLPELVWYDALTSRESLVMALMTTATVPIGMIFLRHERLTLFDWRGALACASFLLLAFVRTSMVLPASAAVLILFLTLRVDPRKRIIGFVIIGVALIFLAVAPLVVTHAGISDFSFAQSLRMAREFSEKADAEWSSRSVGQLLVPKTPTEELLFAPIRLVFYVVAPLPNSGFRWEGLAARSWEDWQGLLTFLSSAMNIVIFPRAVTSLICAIRHRSTRAQLLLHVPCWIILASITAGNVIILARYRVMAMGFLWATSCLVTRRQARTLMAVNILWYGALAAGGAAYFAYKF